MEEEQIAEVIEKYMKNEASEEEKNLLNHWFDGFNNRPSLVSSLSTDEQEKVSAKMFRAISEAIDGA